MSEPGKPPYRVPSMTEVAAVPWSGLTVADLFSGCGGSCLGFRMAGFRILWANEFGPAARESYRANMAPGTVLDSRDVRVVQPEDVLAATGLAVGELDCLSGSPPCQSFSTAGRREKGWGTEREYEHGARQRNEDLFDEFVRLRDGLMPRTFVAENVAGLVKGTAKGHFLRILRELKRGYRVEARVLDAQWLGVPQVRKRVIFVGVRRDLGLEPAFPSPLPYRRGVRDALSGVGRVEARRIANGDEVPDDVAASLDGYAIGGEWDRLNPGQASDKFFSLVRPRAEDPCPTVTSQGAGVPGGVGVPGSTASVCHPAERRKFSIGELRRLFSFPDDFLLAGTYAQRWSALGNSVPPLMMRAVAEALRDRVLLPDRARGTRRATRREPAKDRAASRGASPGGRPTRGGRGRRPGPPAPSGGS